MSGIDSAIFYTCLSSIPSFLRTIQLTYTATACLSSIPPFLHMSVIGSTVWNRFCHFTHVSMCIDIGSALPINMSFRRFCIPFNRSVIGSTIFAHHSIELYSMCTMVSNTVTLHDPNHDPNSVTLPHQPPFPLGGVSAACPRIGMGASTAWGQYRGYNLY